jgi:hypothetical protein
MFHHPNNHLQNSVTSIIIIINSKKKDTYGEYSQYVDRLYAFATSSTPGPSTEYYRFYINESLPTPIEPIDSKNDTHDGVVGELASGGVERPSFGNGWRRVAMVTRLRSEDTEPPDLSVYHDRIILTWPRSLIIQAYQCHVPAPCIIVPSKKPFTTTPTPTGDNHGPVTEMAAIIRVASGRWSPISGSSLSSLDIPRSYRYIGTLNDCNVIADDKQESTKHWFCHFEDKWIQME